MKTYFPKKDDLTPDWYVVDARDLPLGRLATRIATVLRGKHKPIWTPHLNCGDYVVVVNADKISVTGNKWVEKTYFRHSTHPGGQVTLTLKQMMERFPERVVRRAVWGMLPKGPLGRSMLRRLKIYRGPAHPHIAQNPQPLDTKTLLSSPGPNTTRRASVG